MKPVKRFLTGASMILVCSTSLLALGETPRVLLLDGDESKLTIGQLKPAFIDFNYRATPRVSVAEVAQRYVRLLKTAKDPEIRMQALERLASLESLFGEVVEKAISKKELSEIAVTALEDSLEKFRNGNQNDWMLYDLARAYDTAGRQDDARRILERLVGQFPRSELAGESWFRIGEVAYNAGDYDQAESAFRKALNEPGARAFQANAEYMLGWVVFKQDRLDLATDAFVKVLLNLQKQAEKQIRTELRDDVLRILSVIGEYQGGVDSLQAALQRNRAEALAPLVYKNHYQYYIERERFQDAADVVDFFIATYPASPERVVFHQYRIDAFERGRLPSQAWAERERVANEVGPGTPFWSSQTEEGRKGAREFLYVNLDQLGRKYYALAAKNPSPQDDYRRAANYFSQYADLFPADAKAAETYLLLGESRQKLGDWKGAIEAFEAAGYGFPDYVQRAEAAYAALSAFPAETQWEAEAELRQQRVSAYERFADTYSNDKRAGAVLLAAANERLAMKAYPEAIQSARMLTLSAEGVASVSPTGGQALRYSGLKDEQVLDAWLIQGHAHFAQDAYSEAEAAYAQALKRLPKADDRKPATEENYAACIYRQGEALQAGGQLREAQQQYLRVVALVPGAALAQNAQYDAAMRAIDLEDWGGAIQQLDAYRKTYPVEAARQEVSQKLVFSYQRAGQPAAAAGELLALEGSLDPEAARKARFQAAGLFQEAGDAERARQAYQAYVDKYPQPLEPAVEAYDDLITLAEQRSDREAIQSLRASLVQLEASTVTEQTPRTRSLAAKAALALAEEKRLAYVDQKLTLPLAKSLALKSDRLKALVEDLNRIAAYGIAEYATAATHRMGEAYHLLSQDILASERPAGLSDIELEQYQVLLEEQAYPFEEKAIDLFAVNAGRVPQGVFDSWVENSLQELGQLNPARYERSESLADLGSQLK